MSIRFFALAAALAVLAGGTSAQEKKKGGPPDKMMEDMEKASLPGLEHKVFQLFAGKWEYTGKWYLPGGPMDLDGRASSEVIMDGRFLADNVWSSDGKSFQGRGWWGYDNQKKKYWYAWVDSMGTGLSTGEGTWDPKAKTMTWLSEMDDPMSGKKVKTKEVSTVKSDAIDKDFYMIMDGKDQKMMELHLKRAK